MAEEKGFDFRKLQSFVDIYHETGGTGTSPRPVRVLYYSCRAYKKVRSRTNQSQVHSGSFNLYQEFEWFIRNNPNITIEKDMIITSNGDEYIVKAVMPHTKKYIRIITENIYNG